MEKPIQFENPQGQKLHGMLHLPDGPRLPDAPGVLWLSAGQKVRLGAWCMNVVVARHLARLGVPVLRFDFHGIGDSEGEQPNGQAVLDLYGYIQTGGFKDDTIAAARFMLAETGVTKLIFAGLCGGAISSLFAGPAIPETYGHVLVDLPVTISSAARQKFLEENPVEMLRTRPDEAEKVFMLYVRKALDFEAWRRLLSGQSDYRLLTEALRQRTRAVLARVLPPLPEAVRAPIDKVFAPLPPAVAEGSEPGMTASGEVKNELIAPAFRAVLEAGQRVRFLDSSSYHPTFMAYFGDQHLPADRASWKGFDLLVAPDTNHIFSLEHSQRVLFGGVEAMVREAAGLPFEMPAGAAA